MVLPNLLEALRSYIGFDINSLVFVNEQCAPVDSYTGTTRRPDLHALYLSKFFVQLETRAMLSSSGLLLSHLDVDNTHLYGKRYFNSDFYDIICRPVDLFHGIRLALRDGRRPIACLVLSRPPGSKPFMAADERRLIKAHPYLCHALSVRGGIEPSAMVDSGEVGLVVTDAAARIQYLSPEAGRLLQMALHPRGALGEFYYRRAQDLLRPLARRVAAIAAGADQPAPALHLRNPWGEFSLRGYRLQSVGDGMPALLGIQVARHVPLPLKLLGLASVQALPEREKAICVLLAQQHTTASMARALDRSPHTVISQVRSLYARFGVSSRSALFDTLLGPGQALAGSGDMAS
ncbi:MAG: helix-turn-helix transcriptional regulator [Thiobacillus sp.]|nr:helix-turn-helix transcriptional regulator [Thiobacillus sp.]